MTLDSNDMKQGLYKVQIWLKFGIKKKKVQFIKKRKKEAYRRKYEAREPSFSKKKEKRTV